MIELQQLSTTSELVFFFFLSENMIHCSHFVLLTALISDYIFWAHKNGNIIAALKLFNSQTNIYQTWSKGEVYITKVMAERLAQILGAKW